MPASGATQSRIAAARGIVRSLYALSRYVRLFGLGHARTEKQMYASLANIRGFIPPNGILVSSSNDRLTVDATLLEVTPAEQSFARFLRETQRTEFRFDEGFDSAAMEDVASAMAFDRASFVDPHPSTGIPAAIGEDSREWLRDPSRLLYFINVALREPLENGNDYEHARLAEQAYEDVARMLNILAKLGKSTVEPEAAVAARELQRVPHPLLDMLREILGEFSELNPKPSGDTLLLQAADQLVIRLILTKLENGNIVAADIPALLERMGRQLNTLRSIMPSYEEKMARGGIALESHLETLERELWCTAPDAAKRLVLLFDTAFYVPAPCIEPFLERIIAHGEEPVAATVLKNYGAAVDGRDAEGRRRSAKGIGELADLYALVVPDYVPKLLRSVSRQLMRESDLHMQAQLSTSLVRLSYAVQQQRDFAGVTAASDALDEILHRRPMLGMELRPRISVENKLPDFVDEALSSRHIDPDLVNLLQRHAVPVTQQLCSRFLGCSLREESARLTDLASKLGSDSREELLRRLRTGNSEDALSSAGLVISLAPEDAATILPQRASDWSRTQQDILVRQLAIAASARRGSILLKLLPDLDALIIPGAIDEIGMSGDLEATSALIDIAMAGESARFTDYAKVKAIEALGRLNAAKSTDALNELLHERKMLHWAQPHELRIAALQALHMIDPEQAARFVPQSGITDRELSLGPLAVDPDNPWARQRRYSRVFPVKPMTAVATSIAGKAGLDIVTLSLGGGKARRQGKMQPGSDVNLQLQVALRKLNSHVLVREVAGNEITFEIADIGLSDRSRLRQLLLAQTAGPSPQAAA